MKASSAPCEASARAIPQAIEWSFATPIIKPRLPCIIDPDTGFWSVLLSSILGSVFMDSLTSVIIALEY